MEHGADNRPPDPMQHQARDKVEKFIDTHPEQVFFSRQIEVLHEAEFFSLGDKSRNQSVSGRSKGTGSGRKWSLWDDSRFPTLRRR
jgi:hypothetical protein